MLYKRPIKIRKIDFKSRVTLDTAYGRVADYGKIDNTMELFKTGENSYVIDWTSKDNPNVEAEIGISTKGKRVTDYDGVFELPKEAKKMLKQEGFNLSEVE